MTGRSIAAFVLGTLIVLGPPAWAAGNRESSTPHAVVQLNPSRPISAVAASTDGQYYALGDDAGLVMVYRLSDNLLVHRFVTGGGNGIWCLAFSPDGTQLLVGAFTTYLYDLTSGATLKSARPSIYPTRLAFGPGKSIFGVYNPDHRTPEHQLYRPFDMDEDHSPVLAGLPAAQVLQRTSDDQLAVGTEDGRLRFLWATGLVTSTRVFPAAVVGFQGSTENFRVALADGTIHQIDRTGDRIVQAQLGALRCLEFLPDDRWLAWGDRLLSGALGRDARSLGVSTAGLNMDSGFRRPQLVELSAGRILCNAITDSRNPMLDQRGQFLFPPSVNERFVGWDDSAPLDEPRLVIANPSGVRAFRVSARDVRLTPDTLPPDQDPQVRQLTTGPAFNMRPSDATLARFDFDFLTGREGLMEADVARDGNSVLITVGQPVEDPATKFRHWLVWARHLKTPPINLDGMRREIFSRSTPVQDHPDQMTLSADGTRVFSRWDVRSGPRSFIYDTINRKMVATFEGDLTPFNDGGLAFVGSPDGDRLLLTETVHGTRVSEIEVAAVINRSETILVTGYVASPDGTVLAAASNVEVRFFRLPGLQLIRTVKLPSQSNFSGAMRFSRDGQYLVRLDNDMASLVRVDTGEVTHFMVAGQEWIAFTDDGYFEGSNNAGKMLAAVRGLDAYGMDQLAARYNRPDILMQRLGTAGTNPELFAYFRANYQKRLARMGLSEKALAAPVSLPTSEVVNVQVEQGSARLGLKFSGNGAELARYTVYVNDVPVFGQAGKSLEGKSATTEVSVDLVPGINKFEVSCFNDQGTESLRVLRRLDGPPVLETERPDLYYLGFGVSRYANPDLNLRYADKDALDLEAAFQHQGSTAYRQVFTKTFVNDQVDLQTMTSAKKFLSQARPQDTVVLFIAGHGVFTRDSLTPDYYYIAHQTDIAHLEETAIRFSEVEDLLQGIPSRQKLFLMDTCNSGEVDPLVAENTETLASGSQTRAVRGLSVKAVTPAKSVPRTWLLEKGRYSQNDLIRRSGAIVFSSSKGGEFSYESDEIQNGMFTSALLRVLDGRLSASTNSDGTIGVRSLVEAVSAEVPRMTQEMQHPGVDRDNLSVNFDLPVIDPTNPRRLLKLTVKGLGLDAGTQLQLEVGHHDPADDGEPAVMKDALVDERGRLEAELDWVPVKGLSVGLLDVNGFPLRIDHGLGNDFDRGYVLSGVEDPTTLVSDKDSLVIDASGSYATMELNGTSLVGPSYDVVLTVKGLVDAEGRSLAVVGALGHERIEDTPELAIDEQGTGSTALRLEPTVSSLKLATTFQDFATIHLPPSVFKGLSPAKQNMLIWDNSGKVPTLTVNGTKVRP